MDKVQLLAAEVVQAALAGANLNRLLDELWARNAGLSAAERGAIQDLSYGSLRYHGLLSSILSAITRRPLARPLRALLVIALYQLLYTRNKPYAVVDQAVDATAALVGTQAKALTNAALRTFLRRKMALVSEAQKNQVARFNHPQWWIDRVRADYPACWMPMLDIAAWPPPMTLRVNRRKTSVEAYRARLAQDGIEATIVDHAIVLQRPLPIASLPGFAEGEVSVQDAAAQLAAELLDAHRGQSVLDACSAPGGKAAHVLETADVKLTALDVDEARLARVRENLRRLDLEARVQVADAGDPAGWWDGLAFDRVLVDVPCTASGVVRRHPDIKWTRRPSDIGHFAAAQRRLLDALWPTLKADGKLLYATCSVFPEENGQQIASFLMRHGDARQLPIPRLSAQDGRIGPDEFHDGFFYALLAKR